MAWLQLPGCEGSSACLGKHRDKLDRWCYLSVTPVFPVRAALLRTVGALWKPMVWLVNLTLILMLDPGPTHGRV